MSKLFWRCELSQVARGRAEEQYLLGDATARTGTGGGGKVRIGRLHIETPEVSLLRGFYHGVFGFPIHEESPEKLTLRAGNTAFVIARARHLLEGVYHFAFNIPENQFDEAVQWLRERVMLIADDGGEDTFHHDSWNADSVYFHDPAGNIVEFIARHDLDCASDHPFSGQRVLGVSEIGIASNDVVHETASLRDRTMAPIYKETQSETFTAIGDETGLLIVVKRGRVWFPDTGKRADPMPLSVAVATDDGPVQLDFT